MANHYQVFPRRYRPSRFEEVLGQDAVVRTLSNALTRGMLAHAYLFSGGRGSGKTTLARLLARAINCMDRQQTEPCGVCASCREIADSSSVDVIEIDGASHRGIDEMRQLTEGARYQPSCGKTKIYIIDEVHMLTKEAFNALLKMLEEPPAHVKFFFATTEPQRIPATILSRCQHFALKRPSLALIVTKLRKIAEQEGIGIEDGALYRIAERADGSLRDAEMLFDQAVAFHGKTLALDQLLELLAVPSWELFFTLDLAIFEGKLAAAAEISQQLFQEGKDLLGFVEELMLHLRRLLMNKLSVRDLSFQALPTAVQERYASHSQRYRTEFLLDALEYLQEKKGELRSGFAPPVVLELLLLHLIRQKARLSIEELVEQLRLLEEKLSLPPSNPPVSEPLLSSTPLKPAHEALSKSQTVRYETVMRFAAVELEGTLQRE